MFDVTKCALCNEPIHGLGANAYRDAFCSVDCEAIFVEHAISEVVRKYQRGYESNEDKLIAVAQLPSLEVAVIRERVTHLAKQSVKLTFEELTDNMHENGSINFMSPHIVMNAWTHAYEILKFD